MLIFLQNKFIFVFQDLYLLKVCLLGHIVQLLLTYEDVQPVVDGREDLDSEEDQNMECESKFEAKPETSSSEEGGSGKDAEWLQGLLTRCRCLMGLPKVTVNAQNLLEYIKKSW